MVTGCAVIVVLLHLVFAFWRIPTGWGVHFLAFFPAWVAFGVTALTLLLLMPPVSERAVQMLSTLRIREVHLPILRHRRVRYALASLLSLIPFYLLRVRLPTLGDGPMLMRELSGSATEFFREPLTIYLVRLLHAGMGGSGETDALRTYQVLSWACGVLYVYVSLLVSDAVGRDRRERTILRLFLLTVGTIELFFGYVENYAPLAVSVLAYLYVAWRYLDGQSSLTAPALVWGVTFAFHFSAVVLFPSLIFLYYTQWRRSPSKLSLCLNLAIPPALILFIFLLVGFDLKGFFQSFGKESHAVPLWMPEPFYRPHTLLSPVHLMDVINQHLLTIPMGLPLIGATLFTVRNCFNTPHFILLSSVTAGYIVFATLLNPLLGAFRDWDLLSPMAVPIALLSAYLLTRGMEPNTQTHGAWILSVVALFHLIPWLCLNADTERSLVRSTVTLKDGSRLSTYAWGEGNNQLRDLYEKTGKKREALEAAKVALNAQPRRSWLLTNALRLTEAVEGWEKAEFFLKEAIARDPDFDFARFRLAYLYYQNDKIDSAINEYRQVVKINPNFAEAYNNLGAALERKNDLDGAISAYRQATKVSPDFFNAHYNLGVVLERKGDLDGAISEYRQAVKSNPNFVNAYYSLGIVLAGKGDTAGAIQEYRNYIRLSTDEQWKWKAREMIRKLGGAP